MPDLLADTLFSFARYGEETNMNPNQVFQFCSRHFALCSAANNDSLTAREDLATAHTGLAQAYLLLDDYAKAVEECQKCRVLDSQLPDVISGAAFPQFSNIYEAWGLFGLTRYDEAASLLLDVVRFRERKFGVNDTQSVKYDWHASCFYQ